jgi:rhodanese-related sulfurtransferase
MIKSNENLIILDVRNSGEYMTEHIRSAINIPLKQIEDKVEKLSRDKDVLVYCETGARSIRAVRKLEILGYTRIFHMHQGLRGWKKAGFPTEVSRRSK